MRIAGRIAAGVLVAALGVAAWLLLGQYTRAASLIVLGAAIEGRPATLARLHARPVEARDLTIPTREQDLRARAYSAGSASRTVVLITGVHPEGIDDPRLIHFARSLASVGLAVVTPELPRLVGFEVTPDATDAIEDVASWAAVQAELAPDGRVGVAGISFSGGLALVAAGRQPLRDRIAFVLSIGGHGDLPRTLEHLAGGVLIEEAAAPADAFGLAIVLASVAERAVPPDQTGPLREWARTFLAAAHLPFEEWTRRQRAFARAARLAAALPEPSATLVRHVLAEDADALRPHLLPHVLEFAAHPALSPERSPPPLAPVYLLHGTDDEVIPPGESVYLAAHLRAHGPVRVLLTPLLTHVDVMAELTAAEAWALVAFLASLLRQ